MSNRNYRWMARDKSEENYIGVWDSKESPIIEDDGCFRGGDGRNWDHRELYLSEVKFMFGFVPRKGQCLRVEFKKEKWK